MTHGLIFFYFLQVTALALLILSAADMIYQVIRFMEIGVKPVDYYTPFMLFITVVTTISFSTLSLPAHGLKLSNFS